MPHDFYAESFVDFERPFLRPGGQPVRELKYARSGEYVVAFLRRDAPAIALMRRLGVSFQPSGEDIHVY